MKTLKVVLFLILSVIVIAGCTSKDEGQPVQDTTGEQDAKEPQAQVELEWIAHPVYSLQAPGQDRVDYLQSKIDEFEAANPNFKIKPEVLSSNISEAMARLLEQAAQNRAPAIAQIDAYILPRFYEYLQPLDSLFEQAGLNIEDFFPFAQDVMKGPDGKIYGIQFTTDTRVLYYRTDLVPNPPETWEEVLEIGQKLKEDGYDAFLFPGGRGEGTSVTTALPFFWAQGGQLVNEDGQAVFGEGQNKEYMLNALNFIQESVQQGVTPQRVANYGSESDINAEVATGKVAMFMGGNWQINQLVDIISEDDLSKWAIAPLPQLNANNKATSAGGWALGIFAQDPAEQEAAFDFLLRTFIGDEGMGTWTTLGGYLPTRESVYENEFFIGNEDTDVFKDHLSLYANTRPSATIYPEISSQLQIMVSSVISGSKSPEEALEEAWQEINK